MIKKVTESCSYEAVCILQTGVEDIFAFLSRNAVKGTWSITPDGVAFAGDTAAWGTWIVARLDADPKDIEIMTDNELRERFEVPE